jgi:gluconolactonase
MTARAQEFAPGLVEHGLVSADAELEPVANGFTYTEGPAWDLRNERLYFHDVPENTRYSWSEAGGLKVEQQGTQFSNGMTFDAKGRLLICEQGTNTILRVEDDGSITRLTSHHQGKELNSPNDIVTHSSGDVYFTDPAYGRIPVYGIERPRELDFQGIYRVSEDGGEAELLDDSLVQPNGLAFNPEESILYVADCETAELIAFDVDANGGLSNRRVFNDKEAGVILTWEDTVANNLSSGYLDGMRIDVDGNVYTTGRGGIWVLTPEGEKLGVLGLPEDIANLTWGGADLRDLYLCCRSTIYRVHMDVTGHRVRSS